MPLCWLGERVIRNPVPLLLAMDLSNGSTITMTMTHAF